MTFFIFLVFFVIIPIIHILCLTFICLMMCGETRKMSFFSSSNKIGVTGEIEILKFSLSLSGSIEFWKCPVLLLSTKLISLSFLSAILSLSIKSYRNWNRIFWCETHRVRCQFDSVNDQRWSFSLFFSCS